MVKNGSFLITGAEGQLAYAFQKELEKKIGIGYYYQSQCRKLFFWFIR